MGFTLQEKKDLRQVCFVLLEDKAAWPDADELKQLIARLKRFNEYEVARRLLRRAHESGQYVALDIWLAQQMALCTYKDASLSARQRLADSLGLLIAIRHDEADPAGNETRRLLGAVYKRRWELFGNWSDARHALDCYLTAWSRNKAADAGYGGVNAAFLLDALAEHITRAGGVGSAEAEYFHQQADSLRAEMRTTLALLCASAKEVGRRDESSYWLVVTYAEVLFGLSEYDEAGDWLAVALTLSQSKVADCEAVGDEWQRETTVRQLVRLGRMQGHVLPGDHVPPANWAPPWQALARFFPGSPNESAALEAQRAFSCWRGKVGLALSGGGFRASFYHLGVLARLAEMDVLRGVDVLSTVSGGSILAGRYYLALKDLLERKPDQELTKGDYLHLVRRLVDDFTQRTQRNLRMRALINPWKNLRMVFDPGYSRTHRLGELYEGELYTGIGDGHAPAKPRPMRDLLIRPVDESDTFNPIFSNWRRRARIPVWVVNATTLNSGHNWQFTARSMGEAPGLLGEEVDMVERYRRVWYDDAPTAALKDFRMGHAVAASAGVPLLFEPMPLAGLYPGRTIQLVDGGVFDNQGTQALLDEDCSLILCSDASGQLSSKVRPRTNLLAVQLRMNDVLMDRVRESEFQDLKVRADSGGLVGFFYVHLKNDLPTDPIAWTGCTEPPVANELQTATAYGIDRGLQRHLSEIRTDLDAFTEVEAYALMYSGYRMTEHTFRELDKTHQANAAGQHWGGFKCDAPRDDWRFFELEPLMGLASDSSDVRRADLARQLEVGAAKFLKAWKLLPLLTVITVLVLLGLVGLLGAWLCENWNTKVDLSIRSFTFDKVVVAVALALLVTAVPVLRWFNPRTGPSWQVVARIGLALFGWIVSALYIVAINPLYLRRGSLERLLKLR